MNNGLLGCAIADPTVAEKEEEVLADAY